MEHVRDINLDPFSNTIETHVLNLRKKIDRPSTQKLIHSIPGRGYKIDFAK
jgi:DNA-binding response OmpR family regulator